MLSIYKLLFELNNNRSILLSLAKRNFRQKYFGSALGFFWGFIEPVLFISILYAVFTLGLRVNTVEDLPFAVYLICGIVAWLYFSSTFSASSNAISQHSFLVNNLGFRNSFLPLINIVGNLIPHAFLLMVAIFIAWAHGYTPSLYTLQVFYYLFAAMYLLVGLSLLTSSTNLFLKDVGKLVSVMVQFGFWLTPVFWNASMVPEKYQWLIKLNPVFYIVKGYRESLVHMVPFWSHPLESMYFWVIATFILLAGISVFNKLEPHFGDVI